MTVTPLLIPCAVAGLEPSWRCNWRCLHCYYVRDPRLGTNQERTFEELTAEVDKAKARGCNRITLVGQGEPTLYPRINDLIKYASDQGMCSAIITNGASGVKRYEQLYEAGLDHVLLSMHGTGAVLDEIAANKTAAKQQIKLLEWFRDSKRPFRTNATVQKANYQHLPEIAQAAVDYGAVHCVILGFLPHYDWKDHLDETAVSPALSAPFVEAAADRVLAAGRMLTIRYQPHCLLKPKYWPYIVNARYVPFDPWEWDNDHHDFDVERVWRFALQLGDSVAVKGAPCDKCAVKMHCGGYNKIFQDIYGRDLLRAVRPEAVPPELRDAVAVRGGLHTMNPANHHCGVFLPESVRKVEALAAARAGSTLPPKPRDISLPVV